VDPENQVAHWTFWIPDSEGKRFKFKCSVCQVELDFAVVFPEHGLRVCSVCVENISMACKNHVSSVQTDAGSAIEPLLELSRDNTTEEV
jgi:hypothetical protein